MRMRYFALPMVAALVVAAALLWWWERGQSLSLEVVHQGSRSVDSLRLYGDGLAGQVHILALEPGSRLQVQLSLRRHGALRLSAEQGAARVESRLLEDVGPLRGRRLTLEVGPGQRYALRADSMP